MKHLQFKMLCANLKRIFFVFFQRYAQNIYKALQHVQEIAKGQSIYNCCEPRCILGSVAKKEKKGVF